MAGGAVTQGEVRVEGVSRFRRQTFLKASSCLVLPQNLSGCFSSVKYLLELGRGECLIGGSGRRLVGLTAFYFSLFRHPSLLSVPPFLPLPSRDRVSVAKPF